MRQPVVRPGVQGSTHGELWQGTKGAKAAGERGWSGWSPAQLPSGPKPVQEGDSPSMPPTSLLPRILKMEEFFPETYRLDIRDERETFFGLFDGERQLEGRVGETGSGPHQGWV